MRVLRANHHAVRIKRVVQRGALAQEFGVGNHGELTLRFFAVAFFVGVLDEHTHPVARANWHGRFVHDHQKVVVHRLSDCLGSLAHRSQVGIAIRKRWRAHRDENHIRMRKIRFFHAAHKAHPTPHLS